MSRGDSITLYMWGFQRLFRGSFQIHAQNVFDLIGVGLTPTVLLLGVATDTTTDKGFPACIEPEDDAQWPVSLVDGLADRVHELLADHPLRDVLYGDARSMDRKPRAMFESSVRTAAQERMDAYDREHGTISFCGAPGRVDEQAGEYVVVPVLQFDRAAYEKVPRLQQSEVGEGHHRFHVSRGFLDSVVDTLLEEARIVLKGDEPGAALHEEFRRDPADVLRSAGRDFMLRVGWAGGDIMAVGGLYDACTTIASLRHEKAESVGGLVLGKREHPALNVVVRFRTPIPLRTASWTRKILQLTSKELLLLSDGSEIYGLGTIITYDAASEDLFVVRFTGFHQWDLEHADAVLMRTSFNVPGLPKARLERRAFVEHVRDAFGGIPGFDADELWAVVEAATGQPKGTMVVITPEAELEADRLATQATPIAPQKLTPDLVRLLTSIDGAVLVDPAGLCHAIGVILDGRATPAGDPSRGARFNSAIRYTSSSAALAVVISEDGGINVLPKFRRKVKRSDVAAVFAELHAFVQAPNWRRWPQLRDRVEGVRFYVTKEQAEVANADLEALQAASLRDERLWVMVAPFQPSGALDASMFADEELSAAPPAPSEASRATDVT
jgi:hypothetical protein